MQNGSPKNVADRLHEIATKLPGGVAVACPGRGDAAGRNAYTTCEFRELDADADALARGLIDLGVQPGMRLTLLVKPGVEFVKLVFALLRSGATTVLIDPGMGRPHLVDCLAAMQPDGFVAVSAAQALRALLGKRFPTAKLNVTVGRRWFWGGPTLKQLMERGRKSNAKLPTTHARDPAAVIFTSGSTGPPKGVLYTHEMFDTQVAEIQRQYDIQPGGADLACFALFGLFNSAMGVTTVFPKMDFSRPASADPRKLLAAASDWQVTQAFASPSVWDKLSKHCEQTGELIVTLRKVFSCGAPVPADVLQRTLAMVDPYAEMHTPYGATESLPVATIAASEVLEETAEATAQGAGVCVGKKFDSIDWRVIRIRDEPIAAIEDAAELSQGEIGELIVRGPQVSPLYLTGEPSTATVKTPSHKPDHNAVAKIVDGQTVWHRLGDVGYLDEQERFWYCGRKAHRVETRRGALFTICCEAVFNTHPDVQRSALVGSGAWGEQIAVLVVEPTAACVEKHGSDWSKPRYRELEAALLEMANQHEALVERNVETERGIPISSVLFHPSLPVDVRHNAKINREQLAAWAVAQLPTAN